MNMSTMYAPRFSTGSWNVLDENVWEKIDLAFGGAAQLTRAAVLKARDGRPDTMVLVFRRGEFPPAAELCSEFRLTRREAEIAFLLSHQVPNRDIARRLGITLNTVRRHSENVMRKLALKRRSQVRSALLKRDLPIEAYLEESFS